MKRFLVCSIAMLAVLSMGFVLLHCGSSGDDKECTGNADCPQGYWCDLTIYKCKEIDCVPNCTSKCCGEDGCGGQCTDTCGANTHCNTQTCVCDPDTTTCVIDSDCGTDQCCKTGSCEAKNCGTLQCGPDPTCGFECGPCGTGFHCNQGVCEQDVTCTTDAQCQATECCKNSVCVAMACGALECGPDPVCSKECGPCQGGEVCNNGVCETQGQVLCPEGQECVDVTQGGIKGCLLPGTSVPPNAPVCSAADPSCDGNFYCVQISETEFFCIEHCGACAAGQACWTIGGGSRVCLTPEGDVPPNIPYCDETTECTGNTVCIYNTQTGEYYGCVSLCSAEYGPCTNGERVCEGEAVMECQNNAWVNVENCDPNTQACEDGACVNLQSCSMVNGAGDCPAGEMCYPWDSACTVFNCYTAGTVPVGGTCASLNECVPGAICMSDNFCRLVCSATITCTAPEECQNITDCPTDFGICAPPPP